MLNEYAGALAYALRREVGRDSVDVGPDISRLLAMDHGLRLTEMVDALAELEQFHFVRVDRGQPADIGSMPLELSRVVGVRVQQSLHDYCSVRGL